MFKEAKRHTSERGDVHIDSEAYLALLAFEAAYRDEEHRRAEINRANAELDQAVNRRLEQEQHLLRALESHYADDPEHGHMPDAMATSLGTLIFTKGGAAGIQVIKTRSYADLYRIEPAPQEA